MSDVWISLKNSLNCKPHSTEVHDPIRHHRSGQIEKQGKIESSNAKHERKKHPKKQQTSPMSQASSAILNPVTHEIVLDDRSGEFKICLCLCCPYHQINEDGKAVVEGTHRSTRRTMPSRQTHYVDCDKCNIFSKPRVSVHKGSNDPPASTCHRECCGEQNSVEEQDLNTLENAVIQLHQEDSSFQIIERICQTNKNINSESLAPQIECVLKVQNTPRTFASFEDCRQMVRANAEKLQNRHPRCLADGNEQMRFHGTTIACSLGVNGSSNLCTLDQCGVCQILRHGFSTNQEFHGARAVLTTSTSEPVLHYTSIGSSSGDHLMRKCVIVCRVIAGKVHNPLQDIQETTDSGFDSLVKKVSSESDIEELCVLNPKAILPCFVVIYKF